PAGLPDRRPARPRRSRHQRARPDEESDDRRPVQTAGASPRRRPGREEGAIARRFPPWRSPAGRDPMSNGGITRVASAEEEAAVGSFPCTLLQERLWKQQRTRGPQGLNVAMRWLIEGPLPHATAERALQAVVDRHEILR